MPKDENLEINEISYEDIMSFKYNLDYSKKEYEELEYHYQEGYSKNEFNENY